MVMLPDQAFEDDLEKLHKDKSEGKLPAQQKQQTLDPRALELIKNPSNSGDAAQIPPSPDAIAALHGAMGNQAVGDLLAARKQGPADGKVDTPPGAADGIPDAAPATDMAAPSPKQDATPAGPPVDDATELAPSPLVPAIGAALHTEELAPGVGGGAPKAHIPSPDQQKPSDTATRLGKDLDDLAKRPDLKRVDPAGAMPHLPLTPRVDPGARAPKPGDAGPDAGPRVDPGKLPGPGTGTPDATGPADGAPDAVPITDPVKPAPGGQAPNIPGPDAMPGGPGAQPAPQVPPPAGPVVDENAPGPLVPGTDAMPQAPDATPQQPDPAKDPANPDPANQGPDAAPKDPAAPDADKPKETPKAPVNEGPSKDPAKQPAEPNAKPKDEVKPAPKSPADTAPADKDPGAKGPGGPVAGPQEPAAPTGPMQVAPMPPTQDPGPGGTMEEYMASHPDPAAAERVEGLAGVNTRADRNATLLNANVPKPPDRSFLMTLGIDKDWANMQKALKTNPFNGEGSALEFITKLNSILDFAKDAAGKIGLAATIGGAILTLLVPPVGAFLLTVGRVANAVALVLSGLRLVTGILSAVMLAVRIAKEKDPVKRLEMAQMMQQECTAVVGAGIDLILSKLGGKAKGGGKVAGQKATDAMKTAWKDAKGISKATSALKAGASTLKQNVGTSIREGVKGAKQNLTMMKKLGVGGTLKAGLKGAKDGIKGTFTKPFGELKSAVGDFKYVAKDFKDFRSLWKTEGYWGAVGKTNFPNLSQAGAKWNASGKSGVLDRAKLYGGELKRDMLDATAGGYATRIYSGLNGVTHDGATKKQLKNASINNPTTMQSAQAKLQKMEDALASGSRNKKITAVNGGDKGMLSDALYAKGKTLDDAGLISASYRNRAAANYTDETLDAALKVQIKQAKSDLMLFDPVGSVTGGAGSLLNSKVTLAEGVLRGGGKLTGAGADLSAESRYSDGAPKPGFVNQYKAEQKAQASSELTSFVEGVQAESRNGVTGAKVELAFASVAPLLDQRARDIEATMAAKAGGAPGSSVPYDPPPPPPPEGTVVPSADLLPRIQSERGRIAQIRARVEADVKAAQEMKVVAEQSLQKATGAKTSLGKARQTMDKQGADAMKDSADITKAKLKNEEAKAKLAGGKTTAEGERGKADAKANEGRGVKADPDKGKRDAEERKKAEADKREWDAKYSRAGWFERRKMDAQKLWASFTNFLKRAADWVWKKLIQPAINAVKSALNKVMGFLTDLIMKGVMGIVKLFLSEEEKKRLDDTMIQLKEQQAKQAEAKILESKQAATQQTTKATQAETKAREEMARCDSNVQQGQQILAELDANDQALAGEETKVTAARAAFVAQYKPYFDWVARQEQRKAQAGQPGMEGQTGPAFDPATHPADRPLPPQVTGAVGQAADTVAEDSRAAQGEVAVKTMATRDTVRAKATAFDDEPAKRAALENGADDIAGQTVQNHGATEGARRARLAGIKAQATAAGAMPGMAGITKLKELQKRLAEEAAGVDVARDRALKEMRQGFLALVRHQG